MSEYCDRIDCAFFLPDNIEVEIDENLYIVTIEKEG